MIPQTKELFKLASHEAREYLVLHDHNYFAMAQEYIELQEVFLKETLFGKISLWIEMLIQPLYTIISAIWMNQQLSMFAILNLKKTLELWMKWFRYQDLLTHIRKWMPIVRSIGGPFISTNDATYHMYVYADAMTRLRSAVLSKKCTKRL